MSGYKIIGLIIFFNKRWECKSSERRTRPMGKLFNALIYLKKNLHYVVRSYCCRIYNYTYDFLVYFYSTNV